MLLGSGDPTPYDAYALAALCALAATLFVGCILGPKWVSHSATLLRWGATVLAAGIVAAVLIFTPTTSGIVGAGRMLTLLPAAVAVAVLFFVWSWRVGHF